MFHEKRLIFREVDSESRNDEPIPLRTSQPAQAEQFSHQDNFESRYVNARALLETLDSIEFPENRPLGLDYMVDDGFDSGQLVPLGQHLLEAKAVAKQFAEEYAGQGPAKRIQNQELMVRIETAINNRAITKSDINEIIAGINRIMDEENNWAWADDLDDWDDGLDEGEGGELAA